MKIIFVLLCLALAGCATAVKKQESCPGMKKEAVTVDQKELDNMISLFTEEIRRNPGYAGAYYNRAVAYYHKKEYDKSWQDVRKVQKLNPGPDPALANFVERLQKASGKEK